MEEPHLGVKFDVNVLPPRHALLATFFTFRPRGAQVEGRIPPKYTKATCLYIAPSPLANALVLQLGHIGLGSVNLTREVWAGKRTRSIRCILLVE